MAPEQLEFPWMYPEDRDGLILHNMFLDGPKWEALGYALHYGRLMCPKFYIIGGFFRDADHGKDFKDIDVFIPTWSGSSVPYEISKTEYVTVGGVEINITRVGQRYNTLSKCLHRLDIGLCQIGCDPEGNIYCTQGYLDDKMHQTLTILRDTRQSHVDRVSAKYPEYTVVNPHGYEVRSS